MKTVELNIKRLRDGGFVVDTERAEMLSKSLPNHENILGSVYSAIEEYEDSKSITLTRLPSEFSLQKCSAAFDRAILMGALIHKDNWGGSTTGSEESKEPLMGKDQNIINPTPNFDAFVSYSDLTGKTYAETIKNALERDRITTFVAHLEKSKYADQFRKIVDNVILNSRYFILLINIDTLERPEVIREVKRAYPNGKTLIPQLVVFRELKAERNSQEFLNATGIDISLENQHDFSDTGGLATEAISLCKAGVFTRMTPELIPQATQGVSEADSQDQRTKGASVEKNVEEDKEKIKEFKGKLARCNLWRYFEIKGLLYKTPNDDSPWKIQFMHVALHDSKPNDLRGKCTEHLRLVQVVQEISNLDDLLDQIAFCDEFTIDGISGSLELMKNKIREDSYYIDHPQTKLFGIHKASVGLLKPGNTSSELFDNDRTILRELEDKYDTLSDVVANLLNLPFWDGSYSPFIVVFAPIPLEIINLKLTDTAIMATLSSSPLVDLNGLELELRTRDHTGRQLGEAKKITGFRRTKDTKLILEGDLTGFDTGEFRVVKLSYYKNPIQEKFYGRKRTTAMWYPLN